MAAKAVIKIVTVNKEFRPDQIQIMKRVSMVLVEHDLSVALLLKEKKVKRLPIKLKAV